MPEPIQSSAESPVMFANGTMTMRGASAGAWPCHAKSGEAVDPTAASRASDNARTKLPALGTFRSIGSLVGGMSLAVASIPGRRALRPLHNTSNALS